MPDEKPYKYENLPIPTYDEATSSRAPTPASPRPDDGHDEERRGLLGGDNGGRLPVQTRRPGYRPPTVEDAHSDRDSLDALELLDGGDPRHSNASGDEEVRREMQEMEIMDPPAPQSRWTKRISSISQSLHFPFKLKIPKFKLPAWNWSWKFKMPELDSNMYILAGRVFAILLIMGIAYVLFMSDLFTSAATRMGGQRFDLEQVNKWVQEQIDPNKIRDNLKYITGYDHMAGTEGDYVLSQWVAKQFQSAGLESVRSDQYEVYLNYPKPGGRAVELLNKDGTKKWSAAIEENTVYPDEHRQQAPVFHGHSRSGDVKGPLIYVNYGSREDFKHLHDSGIETKGAIALVRYYGTQGDRALKVRAAEEAGFAGCIIYSDPREDGFWKGDPYPKGRTMPADGVQRGSVSLMSWVVGDVLTPGWASKKGAKRLSTTNNPGLVNIPSIPLAWRDAQPLLQAIKGFGQAVPPEWKGGVPNVDNWWSGNLSSPVVRLKNEQDEVQEQPIWNVMAQIRGIEQTEKAVIVGNHRDAWTFGAADPGSGTAVLVEIARVLGELKRKGWRPLRSIEFASWDGEEYNLIGSTEYVEDHMDALRRDGYAYLNVDVAVSGQNFWADASPVFSRALKRVLNQVGDPNKKQTLLEIWEESGSKIGGLGAGSDYIAFQDMAGVSSIDFGFQGEPFPYHSVYDNFEWMDKFGDPGFTYHQMLGQVWALLILEMADRPVLPFDMTAYSSAVTQWITNLEHWVQSKGPNKAGTTAWSIEPLRNAILQFKKEADEFEAWESNWETVMYGGGGFESTALGAHRMSHNNRAANFETLLLDLEEGGGVSQHNLSYILSKSCSKLECLTNIILSFRAASSSSIFSLHRKSGQATMRPFFQASGMPWKLVTGLQRKRQWIKQRSY
jgi:hypothetical protein